MTKPEAASQQNKRPFPICWPAVEERRETQSERGKKNA